MQFASLACSSQDGIGRVQAVCRLHIWRVAIMQRRSVDNSKHPIHYICNTKHSTNYICKTKHSTNYTCDTKHSNLPARVAHGCVGGGSCARHPAGLVPAAPSPKTPPPWLPWLPVPTASPAAGHARLGSHLGLINAPYVVDGVQFSIPRVLFQATR